ncbi:hypothetical protein V6N11_000474 [Hibiscus sabdariffa]|uniref:Uncharacterized protein n=1 Tax=Hibiscus sabdariffa TaxID=183260 RepID=A0ABR2NT39_9ROSI
MSFSLCSSELTYPNVEGLRSKKANPVASKSFRRAVPPVVVRNDELTWEASTLFCMRRELLSLCYKEKDFEGLPFDFYGGFIGYMGCVVYTNVDFFQLFLPYRNKMLFKLDRRNPILLLAVILSASPSRVSMSSFR